MAKEANKNGQGDWVKKVDKRTFIPSHFNPNRVEELADPERKARAVEYIETKCDYIGTSVSIPYDVKLDRIEELEQLSDNIQARYHLTRVKYEKLLANQDPTARSR